MAKKVTEIVLNKSDPKRTQSFEFLRVFLSNFFVCVGGGSFFNLFLFFRNTYLKSRGALSGTTLIFK